MEKLAQLSESIERLHTNTSNDRKTSGHQMSTSQSSGQRLSDHFNSNLNVLMANDGHPSSRSNDPANTTSPLATSSPQNANTNSTISNNANHSSSPVNSNVPHGQHNANVMSRSRNTKNGKISDS